MTNDDNDDMVMMIRRLSPSPAIAIAIRWNRTVIQMQSGIGLRLRFDACLALAMSPCPAIPMDQVRIATQIVQSVCLKILERDHLRTRAETAIAIATVFKRAGKMMNAGARSISLRSIWRRSQRKRKTKPFANFSSKVDLPDRRRDMFGICGDCTCASQLGRSFLGQVTNAFPSLSNPFGTLVSSLLLTQEVHPDLSVMHQPTNVSTLGSSECEIRIFVWCFARLCYNQSCLAVMLSD